MFHKILKISLLPLLIIANFSVAQAANDLEPDTTGLSQCVTTCLGDNDSPTSRQINRCQDNCNSSADSNSNSDSEVNSNSIQSQSPEECQSACMKCSSFDFSARYDATSEQLRQNKESACQRECRANTNFTCNTLPPIPKPDILPGPDIGISPTGEDVVDYVSDRVLPKLASRLISLIAVITILMLVLSGLMMIAAAGNEDQLKKARQTALFASLGLGLALLSFAIIDIINNLNLST